MSLDVGLSRVCLVTLRTFKLAVHAVALSMDGALQQGVKAFTTLFTEVLLSGAVRFPMLHESGRTGTGLAADGAVVGQLAAVALLVVGSQGPEIDELARTEAARERGFSVKLAAVFSQIPGMLERLLTVSTTEWTLTRVSQLVASDIGRAGELAATRVTYVPGARIFCRFSFKGSCWT